MLFSATRPGDNEMIEAALHSTHGGVAFGGNVGTRKIYYTYNQKNYIFKFKKIDG